MKAFITGFVAISLVCFISCTDASNQQANNNIKMEKGKIEYLSPDGLHKNPAYSQVIVTKGNFKTIYVGGQNAVNKHGQVVGKGDIKAQAEQILTNLQTALQAAGGTFNDVIKWDLYIVQGQPLDTAFKVFQKTVEAMPNKPLVTGAYVTALAHPDYLLEMSATAIIPEE